MEDYNQLILNQRRDFSDVIGDGLKFMKINFLPMLNVFLTYVIPSFFLPILIILALGFLPIFLEAFTLDQPETIDPSVALGSAMGFIIAMIIFLIFMAVGYMLINLTVFGTFLAYEENGNDVVTAEQIKRRIKENFANYLVSLLVLIPMLIGFYFIMIMMSLAAAFIGVLAVFLVFLIAGPLFIWFMINLVNFSWIRIRENVGIGTGMARAFALTKSNWWSTFGVLFVASLITTVAGYTFSIPFHLLSSFAGISGFDNSGSTSAMVMLAGFGFLVYMLGSAFVQQYLSACAIMKYFDQVERKDGSSITAQLDELGENRDSFFENEGEY